jgi:Ca-activated chloride channel family protein
MSRHPFRYLALSPIICAVMLLTCALDDNSSAQTQASTEKVTQGALQVVDASGKHIALCPLKHTSVKAEVSGFISRVTVTQEFENPFKEKIEAVYTFPLPVAAAVDDMTMRVGERTVRGRILRREEAETVYEAAKSAGQVASLLNQERPNIFTQSVANIMPGERVTVEISYVETLKYEAGTYEFVFPMVVGPRYIPGAPTIDQNGKTATDRVPDASRITPPLTPAGTRAGHDISIEVALDAGVPVDALTSSTHEIQIDKTSDRRAVVRLKNKSEIPNKDFILKYDVAGKRVEDAVLTHRTDRGGFFTMILQPPERVTSEDVTPKELVFVLDTSGSMNGFPIEKAKETMKLALAGLYPQDTFNLITFAGDTHILFPEPVSATPENLRKAQEFLESRKGSGGTEMMKAIRAALDPTDAQGHVRIVCFMTDGYVGNDAEIIGEVQKHPNARVFSFGIGGSVNRFLLDKMAEHGRGEVEYVGLNDDGSAAARRFHERVRSPLLTDISIDWSGLPVADIYPKRIPDLFSAKPVILTGRYTAQGRALIQLKGKMAGRDFKREIAVELPEAEARHNVLSTLWARTRIDDLVAQDYSGLQQGAMHHDVRETITQLGLEYRLMTQFTSFVAVEEVTVTDGGQPRRIEVPVELPEGVSREGVTGRSAFGAEYGRSAGGIFAAPTSANMTVNATVSVTDTSGSTIDTTTSGGTTVLDKSVIDPGSRARGDRKNSPRRARGREKNTGGGAGGGGGGGTDDNRTSNLPKEEESRRELLAKLHPSVAALIQRLKDKTALPGADETKFVRDGKAEVKVWLTDTSPEVIALLKQLGLEIILETKSVKLVIGRISLDKLEALAAVKAVRYVAPQKTGS